MTSRDPQHTPSPTPADLDRLPVRTPADLARTIASLAKALGCATMAGNIAPVVVAQAERQVAKAVEQAQTAPVDKTMLLIHLVAARIPDRGAGATSAGAVPERGHRAGAVPERGHRAGACARRRVARSVLLAALTDTCIRVGVDTDAGGVGWTWPACGHVHSETPSLTLGHA